MMFFEFIVKTMVVYVDDMLVKSKKASQHVQNLNEMFPSPKEISDEVKSIKVCLWGGLRKVSRLYGE